MFQSAPNSDPVPIEAEAPSDKLSEKLPQPARLKLVHLRAVRDDIRVMVEAAQAKVERLRSPDAALVVARRELDDFEKVNASAMFDYNFRTQGTPPERQDATAKKFWARYEAIKARVQALEDQLKEARQQLAERGDQWQAAARLVTNLETFVRNADCLDAAEVEQPTVPKGRKAEDEIDKTRELIAALNADRKRVLGAAIPATEAKERVRTFVAGRAAKVSVGGLVSRDRQIGVSLSKGGETFNVACWLNPDAVIRRLDKEIEAELDQRTVLTELEQAKELQKLDAKLLAAARKEEALIVMLERAGIHFARRPQADPRAVLEVA